MRCRRYASTNAYLLCVVHTIVVVDRNLVDPYGVVESDPLRQEASGVFRANAQGYLVEALLKPTGARGHARKAVSEGPLEENSFHRRKTSAVT